MSSIFDYPRCYQCEYYDQSKFPEYNGKLAICKNENKEFIGAGKIGFYTIANKKCFKKK